MCVRIATYSFSKSCLWNDFSSREEGRDSIGQEAFGFYRISALSIAVETRLFEEEEHHNKGDPQDCHSPPKHDGPIHISGRKCAQCWNPNNAQQKRNVENREGSASLMNKEGVEDYASAKNRRNGSTESREQSRNQEWNELIGFRHRSSPDVEDEYTKDAPEDYRASTAFV